MRKFCITVTSTVAAMMREKRNGNQDLVAEDGNVAARSLPLDDATSNIAYETATFGIG